MRIKPLPAPQPLAAPKAAATAAAEAASRSSQPQSDTGVGGNPTQSRSRAQQASVPLPLYATPAAQSPSSRRERISTGTELLSATSVGSAAACNVQLQLSFRNLRDSDILSFSDPIAIVSSALVPPQGGVLSWSEVGRTECKSNSINPNFSQKIIVALPLGAAQDGEASQSARVGDALLRVDVFDMDDSLKNAAVFNPSTDSSDYLGGFCFSSRSIATRFLDESDAPPSAISFFFHAGLPSSASAGPLPPLQPQAPQEFNFMLAATPTPFCILSCRSLELSQSSFGLDLNAPEPSAHSKYPRTAADDLEPRSTSVLHVLTDRDAMIIQQSIAAYAYSFSSTSPAFVKAHRAGRMLYTSDWGALKAALFELVHLARDRPSQFYGLSVHGEQPLSCMFNSCLYSLTDRVKGSQAAPPTADVQAFPDVFTVVAALREGIAAQARSISSAEAAAMQARYCAESLEVACDREVQMLLSRPYVATDASYMGDDYVSKHDDLLQPVPVVDDYTGQNNFHIIIANGTIVGGIAAAESLFSIVTYEPFRQRLLRGRATGRFFCPFYGTVHLGATPLHFAVMSQHIAFVKLILEKLCRSDIDRLDALWDLDNSGNMVLHMAVMAGDTAIYDYLHEAFLRLEALLPRDKSMAGRTMKSIQGDLYIKNANNLTPLELAAALGRRDMLSHIVKTDIATIWEYSEVSLKGYAMRDIDTFKTLALDRVRLARQVGASVCATMNYP